MQQHCSNLIPPILFYFLMKFRAEKLVLKQNNLTMQGFKEAFHSCTLQGSPAIDKAVLKMKVKMF